MRWQEFAACKGKTSTMFPDEDARGEELERQITEAKAVCAGCPVISSCRIAALDPAQHVVTEFGVWGGMSEKERRKLKRELTAPTLQIVPKPTEPETEPAPAALPPSRAEYEALYGLIPTEDTGR